MEKMAPVPIDSSTVILIRDRESSFEIFLMQRHYDMDFMAGAYVFPGGITDHDDCAEDLIAFSKGLDNRAAVLKANETELSDDKVRGILFSAVRETFEEAGILLAYDKEGNIISFNDRDADFIERFREYRTLIYDKKISLADIAEKEELKYGIDMLTHYSHWITPETKTGKMRFDARFFIARVPEGQRALHDNVEMTDSLWVTPGRALEMYRKGELILMPPTFRTVEELSAYSTGDDLYKAVKDKKIYTMLPEFYKCKEGLCLRLPCDPEYSVEKYKQPPDPLEPSCMIIQKNGILKTVF